MDILKGLKAVSVTTITITMVMASVEILQKSYYKIVLNRKMHKDNMELAEETKKEFKKQTAYLVREGMRNKPK